MATREAVACRSSRRDQRSDYTRRCGLLTVTARGFESPRLHFSPASPAGRGKCPERAQRVGREFARHLRAAAPPAAAPSRMGSLTTGTSSRGPLVPRLPPPLRRRHLLRRILRESRRARRRAQPRRRRNLDRQAPPRRRGRTFVSRQRRHDAHRGSRPVRESVTASEGAVPRAFPSDRVTTNEGAAPCGVPARELRVLARRKVPLASPAGHAPPRRRWMERGAAAR